jgi:hypothetical protein
MTEREDETLRAKTLSLGELSETGTRMGGLDAVQNSDQFTDEKRLWNVTEKPRPLRHTRDGINVAAFIKREQNETIPPPPLREK